MIYFFQYIEYIDIFFPIYRTYRYTLNNTSIDQYISFDLPSLVKVEISITNTHSINAEFHVSLKAALHEKINLTDQSATPMCYRSLDKEIGLQHLSATDKTGLWQWLILEQPFKTNLEDWSHRMNDATCFLTTLH